MGFEREDRKREREKETGKIQDKDFHKYIPFEHRVFVCLGTLKHNSAFHAWVMVYSHDLANVTFWDIQEDFHMHLHGRVKKSERAKLRKFLYVEKPAPKKENAFGLGGLPNFGKDKKKQPSKKKLMIEQRKKELLKKK